MLEKKHTKYFESGTLENKKFWDRLGGKPNFSEKSVLDFGCGHGSLCIDVASSGARKIIGVDLNKELIDFANSNLNHNYTIYKDRLYFKSFDLLNENFTDKFDIILSKDTFEHTLNLDKVLKRMHDLLKPGGKAYIGFGPLYNSYNGDHYRTKTIFPWFHLLIPEKIIIRILNYKNKAKIQKIEDLGLNKCSFKDYQNYFNNSPFNIKYFKKNCSNNPVAKIFNLISKIKLIEEYFTFNIYCILEK